MGTTEPIILAALSEKESYGYEICEQVRQRSRGFFQMEQGYLYPALRRMASEKLVAAYWEDADSRGPKRRYYRLTERGRRRLEAFLKARQEFNDQLDRVLAPARAVPTCPEKDNELLTHPDLGEVAEARQPC